MDISNKIKVVRAKLGLSQEQLALELGVSKGTINNWEQGNAPRLDHLVKLSKIMNTTLDGVLYGELSVSIKEPGDAKQ